MAVKIFGKAWCINSFVNEKIAKLKRGNNEVPDAKKGVEVSSTCHNIEQQNKIERQGIKDHLKEIKEWDELYAVQVQNGKTTNERI
jgi:hypothetical protein